MSERCGRLRFVRNGRKARRRRKRSTPPFLRGAGGFGTSGDFGRQEGWAARETFEGTPTKAFRVRAVRERWSSAVLQKRPAGKETLDDFGLTRRSGARVPFDDSRPGEQRKPRGRRSRCGAGMEKTLAVAHAGEERAQPLRSIRSGSADPRPLRRRSDRPSRYRPSCWRCPS